MVSVTIHKCGLDWDIDVSMWFDGSTVFLAYFGATYELDNVPNDFDNAPTEEELRDYFFDEFKEELELDFKPDYEEPYELSNYEFYREKL